MADGKDLRSHRAWEDWLGIALGVLVMLSPWLVNEISHGTALTNAAIAGLVILMLAELDLVAVRRWAEVGLLACGAWVAASPFVLGYGGQLRPLQVVVGGLVALLGAFELWQRQGK
jgi:hypothetical protein